MSLSGSGNRGAVFLRIDSDPAIALWLGFGDIAVPVNDLDLAGQTYRGLGALVGIPELEQLLNGESARADFSMSGVPAAIAALAEGQFAEIEGEAVNIGYSAMDADWQLSGALLWVWDGRVDVLNIAMQATQSGVQVYTLELSVGTANTGRSRPDYANWTDAQHQRAHPGDLFFNHVPPAEKTKRWPGG